MVVPPLAIAIRVLMLVSYSQLKSPGTSTRLWHGLHGHHARSQGCEAPIDEQTGARDVRGFLGRQKQHTRGHFLGRARTLEHGACTGLGTVIVQGFAGGSDAAFVKRRENGAGADRIDPDAVHSVVHSEATGQTSHCSFGGVILEVVASGYDGADG